MKKIKVKKYLEFSQKCQIANEVVEMSFDGIDYDPLVRECAQVFTIAKYYSDVNIELTDGREDAVKTYDKLNRTGIYLNNIYKEIPKQERKKLEELIDNLIDEKKRRSNITHEITKKFAGMDIEKMLEEFKNFDFSKFKEVQKVLEINNSATKKV